MKKLCGYYYFNTILEVYGREDSVKWQLLSTGQR